MGTFGIGTVNKRMHYVLANSLTWFWDHLAMEQWLKADTKCKLFYCVYLGIILLKTNEHKQTLCASFLTDLIKGTFGIVQVI